MNPYYYLFYRISRLLNKKGNNEMGPIFAISLVIVWNVTTVPYIVARRFANEDFSGVNRLVLVLIMALIWITNLVLFLNKERVKEINYRYKGESERSRRIGGFLVILYLVLSFALIFVA